MRTWSLHAKKTALKRPFVLFEILIALSLTAILLTFLFSFFVGSAKLEKKIEASRSAITARQHLQTRLQAVLSGISRESSSAPLYSKLFKDEKKESLIAIFDNGIDPDPAFSGSILGRIYLDEENNLSLATWPLEKEKNRRWRKEILLPHVDNFEFEFLAKKKETEPVKKEKIRPLNANLEWRTHWSKSRTEIPSMVRLSIREKEQKEDLKFAFLLPSSDPIVTYLEGQR